MVVSRLMLSYIRVNKLNKLFEKKSWGLEEELQQTEHYSTHWRVSWRQLLKSFQPGYELGGNKELHNQKFTFMGNLQLWNVCWTAACLLADWFSRTCSGAEIWRYLERLVNHSVLRSFIFTALHAGIGFTLSREPWLRSWKKMSWPSDAVDSLSSWQEQEKRRKRKSPLLS